MLLKNKYLTIAIAIILVTSIAIPLAYLPTANAQAGVSKNTFAVVGAMPNPVGVGQETLITLGITHATAWPQPGWTGITVTVTKPDNTTETLGPFTTDTTGLTGTVYVPTMIGTYYLQTNFPEQVIQITAAGTLANTTMRASQSERIPLVVQENPIQHHPGFPLPTEYWTRPIDAQLREWSVVSGNWLNVNTYNRLVEGSLDAPESAHILWMKQLAEGGLVGGNFDSLSYEHGDAYEGKWNNPVILNGVLYFNRHSVQNTMPAAFQNNYVLSTTTAVQEVVAVDIKTGEELWTKVLGNNERLSHGQVMHWTTMNMHGAFAYLWTVVGSTWHAYDPLTGRWEWSIQGVPGGTSFIGPNGEIMRYTINLNAGTISLWNSTRVVYETYHKYYRDTNQAATADYLAGRWRPHGFTFNATYGIQWSKTIPTGLPGAVQLILNDKIIGSNTNWAGGAAQQNPVFWAISLRPGQEGQLLYNKTWNLPIADTHVHIPPSQWSGPNSLPDDVFVVTVKETRQHYGFDANTGTQIWGPTESEPFLNAYSNVYMAMWGQAVVAEGKLFTGGMAGVINAYDIKTGQHLWTYEIRDRYTEQLFSSEWPAPINFVAAGKVYAFHHEHSTVDPRPRGAPGVALDAETGEVIWRIDGLRLGTRWGGQPIIGDSTIVGFSSYDNRIVAIGKGPSATTVNASPKASVYGTSVVIEGMVTDISPGTQEFAITARFPQGVPAIADESMSDWMLYVYQQFPKPTTATGVPVTIHVVDANGNYREIGTTTSGADGFFSFTWKPDIEGTFFVYASFGGSKSYWPSQASTSFTVDSAPTAPETPTQPASIADEYFVPAIAGIIVAMVIGFALLAVLLLKKRP